MKYRYTQDYESSALVEGKMIVFLPGEVYDLAVVPNRLAAHLELVVEAAPAPVAPKKAPKKTTKKKQS